MATECSTTTRAMQACGQLWAGSPGDPPDRPLTCAAASLPLATGGSWWKSPDRMSCPERRAGRNGSMQVETSGQTPGRVVVARPNALRGQPELHGCTSQGGMRWRTSCPRPCSCPPVCHQKARCCPALCAPRARARQTAGRPSWTPAGGGWSEPQEHIGQQQQQQQRLAADCPIMDTSGQASAWHFTSARQHAKC